ncbi:MAG: hypothetical protein H6672_16610 [Anaerolineaceae bacterium]|nr:hypothetical protein [Anaerolineaceae bacterium]
MHQARTFTITNDSKQYAISHKSVPTFYFIGVTTGKSSINKVFPLWAKALGRPDVVLEGIDCQLNDDPKIIIRQLLRSNMIRCHWVRWLQLLRSIC